MFELGSKVRKARASVEAKVEVHGGVVLSRGILHIGSLALNSHSSPGCIPGS